MKLPLLTFPPYWGGDLWPHEVPQRWVAVKKRLSSVEKGGVGWKVGQSRHRLYEYFRKRSSLAWSWCRHTDPALSFIKHWQKAARSADTRWAPRLHVSMSSEGKCTGTHPACDVSPYPFFFLMGCFQQFFVFFVGPYMRPLGYNRKEFKKCGRKQHFDLVKGQKSKSLPDLPGQKDVADNK